MLTLDTPSNTPLNKGDNDVHSFMTKTQCEIASKGEKLFIDGTFDSVPEPFHQVLITRTGINGILVVVVLLLLLLLFTLVFITTITPTQ
jgi:hypothetical protein